MRPAVVLADADKGDWVLCQITSNAYADALAIELTSASLVSGSLRAVSYARPAKLFTANQSLFVSQVAVLTEAALRQVLEAVIALMQASIKQSAP